jgi:glutamyl-tRNA(Gln) amidotransferase subunit D
VSDDDYKGYGDPALSVLKGFGVRVWSEVEVTTPGGKIKGIILPRAETADKEHIVLKLYNGYNVGVRAETVEAIEEHGYRAAHYKIPEQEFPKSEGKPDLVLLGTGGTIASRLDYRTGAVIPAFSPGELYGAVPELADVCNLETRKLYGIFSENMGWEQYVTAAEAIGEAIRNGAEGLMIGHGTDTMHHTAAALSFMVQNSPVPIVMVGSQRSSDRPSSDAAINLRCAARAAGHGDLAEVLVCMFGPTSDRYNLLHRGTRVRKMHSSHRDTFRTVGDTPLAMVTPDEVTPLREDYRRRRDDREVVIDTAHDDRVTLLYYYPDMKPDIIEAIAGCGYKGLVIAGTGLGHVNRPCFSALQRAIEGGMHVYMTVQTLWGFVQMYVYDTGRDLLDIGVVPAENMLPEVAYVKLGWVLGHTDDPAEVREMMLTPIAGETTEREPHDAYIILQGGLPETQAYQNREYL